MERLCYTPREVADRLGISVDTVLRRIHADDIPALRVSQRVYRVPIRAFELWEAGVRPERREVRVRDAADEPWEAIGEGEPVPNRTARGAAR